MMRKIDKRRGSIGAPPNNDVDEYPTDTPEELKAPLCIMERHGRRVGDKEAFGSSLKQAFFDANLALRNQRSRDEAIKIRKELKTFYKALSKADNYFRGLSEDSFAQIRGAAFHAIKRDPRATRQWTGVKSGEYVSAHDTIEKVESALSGLTKGTESAVQAAGKPRRGKPNNVVATTLASKLYGIWILQTGEKPSITEDRTIPKGKPGRWTGDFVDLCSVAMTKIWARHGAGKHLPDAGYYVHKVASLDKSN